MCLKYHYTYSACQHTEALCTEPCIDLAFPLGEHPNQSDNHVFSSQDLGDPGGDCPECTYAFKSYPVRLTQEVDFGSCVRSPKTTGSRQQTTRSWVQDRRHSVPVEANYHAVTEHQVVFPRIFGSTQLLCYDAILGSRDPGFIGGRSDRAGQEDGHGQRPEQYWQRRATVDCGAMKKKSETEPDDDNAA
ncbi:hypothetical protein MMC27_000389 [Xylographa pallens]|nr:hypothetical protein [Xylographa pallens]